MICIIILQFVSWNFIHTDKALCILLYKLYRSDSSIKLYHRNEHSLYSKKTNRIVYVCAQFAFMRFLRIVKQDLNFLYCHYYSVIIFFCDSVCYKLKNNSKMYALYLIWFDWPWFTWNCFFELHCHHATLYISLIKFPRIMIETTYGDSWLCVVVELMKIVRNLNLLMNSWEAFHNHIEQISQK